MVEFLIAFSKYLWEWFVYIREWTLYYFSWVIWSIKRKITFTFGTLNFLVIFWNFFMILIAEALYLTNAIFAVTYLIWITIGNKLVILFTVLLLWDKGWELFRNVTRKPQPHPYELTALDRGCAFCAGLWPLAEVFMFCQESVRGYVFTNYLNHEYFRGLVVLFSAAPPTTILIAFVVYNQIVRRIGKDTRWFGARPVFGIKYIVRYHWCFALCQHTITTLWIFCFLKFGVANGLKGDEQEVWITSFLFMNLALTAYQMLCAIIGVKCRFPIFHRACIFNCGRQKGSKDKRDPFPEEFDN